MDPQLRSVEIKNGGLLYTMHQPQPALTLALKASTSATIIGDKQLDALTVKAEEDASVDTSGANIHTIEAHFLSGASANFGSLSRAALNVPESCAVNRKINVTMNSVDNLFINGSLIDSLSQTAKMHLPCASVVLSPAE